MPPETGSDAPPAAPPPPAESAAAAPVSRVEAAVHGVPRSAFPRLEASPSTLAVMIDALQVGPEHRVLTIGAAHLFAAASLDRLGGEVYAIARSPRLAERARQQLAAAHTERVTVIEGSRWSAVEEHAPYDRVLVTATTPRVPRRLRELLAEGGLLVFALGSAGQGQKLVRTRRTGADVYEDEVLGEVEVGAPLGDILVELGATSRPVVERAVTLAERDGVRLGQELLDLGAIDEGDLFRAVALQRGLRTAPVDEILRELDVEVLDAVPRAFLERHLLIPLRKHEHTLVAATVDPDAPLIELAHALGADDLEVFLVTPTDYRRLWAATDLGQTIRAEAGEPGVVQARRDDLLVSEGKLDSYMTSIFDALLLDAIGERASDVHLERYEDEVRVRFRVDGVLRDVGRYHLTPHDLAGVVNVVKVSSNLDISERRLPQGGRFRRSAGGQVFDLRVQTQPSLWGEHVVIRLLPQETRQYAIEELGFPTEMAERYRRLLRSPQGLVLVVGPTGCGKSTTLYAGLQLLAEDATRKVITIEDPIEYSIPRVQQTQVHTAIGFRFADAMRAFVREDPDVILVGEIRDSETALEAMRAAETGHLVLSTLHCNEAADAVQRLYDLQQHPNTIASELAAVIAQRLARRICESCREPTEPDPELLREIFPDGAPEGFHCSRGRGCSRCEGQGTRGRIAIIEFLPVDSGFRRGIAASRPLEDLKVLALERGLIPMRDNALSLVERGIVALAELPRVLTPEQLAPRGPA